MSHASPPDQLVVQRVADEYDVGRVNQFFNRKTIKDELHRFTYRTTLDRAFERDDRRLFYVEDDGDLIGALMVWCESRVLDPEEAQIRLVAVHPQYRNQNIARRLCEKAEGFALDYNKERVSADVAQSSSALEFWQSCGYEICTEWETDNGRGMYRVEKQLD